jgi:hypothetical protein
VHTNLIEPSGCITPSPISAPHSPQVICPSCDAISILYRFETPLYGIKICPIDFEAIEARRTLEEKGLLKISALVSRSSSDLIGATAIIKD